MTGGLFRRFCLKNKKWLRYKKTPITDTISSKKKIIKCIALDNNSNVNGGFLYMRATGIVRRIDDLGRVVIPKEIRRTLRIRESEPLEIFTGKEGEIVLKKYSPISEMTGFAKQYVESLSQVSGRVAMVADRDQFIAVAGGLKNMLGKEISKELENRMEKRDTFMATKGDRSFISVMEEMPEEIIYEAVCPILSEGDMIGAVLLLETDNKRKMNEGDLKLIQAAAGFLGKQMEQ